MPKPKFNVEQTADALRATGGVMSAAAEKLGITPSALTNRVQSNSKLQIVRAQAQEATLDLAESGLLNQLRAENMTAIIFLLKTKGKSRGYVERQEVTGPNGQPLEMNVTDYRKRLEGELDRLAAQVPTDGLPPKVH